MSKKDDSEEVSRRLGRHIRQAKHGGSYYASLFILFFAVPLYIILQFFYAPADGWDSFDLLLILALLTVSGYGLYREFFRY